MQYVPDQAIEIWGGMECTINRVGTDYFDQLDYSGHRKRAGDLNLFAELCLKKIRYPVLWEHHQPDKELLINWLETDQKLDQLRNLSIGVIAGLVHHGSGPHFVEILDDSFSIGLANYAGQVAERYPWIEYYTPVNEPLTTARFCGLYGLWYPHQKNDAAFCRILVNECKATVMAMAAIRIHNPQAKLVQTEDLAKTHSTAVLQYQANFENERRWLSFDLLCGSVDRGHPLWNYLTIHGILPEELDYFRSNPCRPNVFGANYYLTSERYLDEKLDDYPQLTHGGNGQHWYADVEAVRVGKIQPSGLCNLLTDAWQRYHLPVAITEVHLHCTREEQMRWLSEVWLTANQLRKDGVTLLAITPWALLGSFGWDRLLTRPEGTYEPGVFDLSSGKPRPTILAQMIRVYAANQIFDHPALTSKGWWKRGSRVSYGSVQTIPETFAGRKSLVVTGVYSNKVTERFRGRFLDMELMIRANEYLEVSRKGRADLVISLNNEEFDSCLNGCIDLLLDGESGYWEISPKGRLVKQAQVFSGHHLLAV